MTQATTPLDHPEWIELLSQLRANPEDQFIPGLACDWLEDYGDTIGDLRIRTLGQFLRLRTRWAGFRSEHAYCDSCDCNRCRLNRESARLFDGPNGSVSWYPLFCPKPINPDLEVFTFRFRLSNLSPDLHSSPFWLTGKITLENVLGYSWGRAILTGWPVTLGEVAIAAWVDAAVCQILRVAPFVSLKVHAISHLTGPGVLPGTVTAIPGGHFQLKYLGYDLCTDQLRGDETGLEKLPKLFSLLFNEVSRLGVR